AEDLVQETFLRAWRSLQTLRDDKSAKAWLLTILRREFARGFERFTPTFADDYDFDLHIGEEPEDDDVLALRQAINML
ncbi:RNA polymerase subunit sigma, partial [Staphylococcus warneri]